MNIKQLKKIVLSAINNSLEDKAVIADDMQLICGELQLNSIKLVEAKTCIGMKNSGHLPFYET